MNDAPKPLWRSRTMWLNAATLMMTLLDVIASQVVLLEPLFPPSIYPWVVACVTIINLWLRTVDERAFRRSLPPPQDTP